jgi:hypothetical protein
VLERAGLDPRFVDDDVAAPLVLVPVDAAKGLEYDHVLLLEPERIYRSDPATGPRKLYVAMTRARSTLQLLHRDRLPRVFDGAESIVHLAPEQPEQPAPHETDETDDITDMDAARAATIAPADDVAPTVLPRRLAERLPAGPTHAGPTATRDLGPCTIPTGRGEVVLADHPGYDRRELIEHAEQLGFAARTEVNERTTMVVVGRTDSTSRRARVARELGVPIASAADLLAARPGTDIPALMLAPLSPR